MTVLAFDLAIRTGWAAGPAGGKPHAESLLLIKPSDPIELLPEAAARMTRDLIRLYKPALIIREAWMAPQAQPSGDAVIAQMLLHGAVMAIAGLYAIPLKSVSVSTWRSHFCGRASATSRSRTPRTPKQKTADRLANKQMVLDRAHLLGYLPRHRKDFDAADAAGIWDYGCAHYAGARPRELHLFGESAA